MALTERSKQSGKVVAAGTQAGKRSKQSGKGAADPSSWLAVMDRADHWKKLDAALAWKGLAELLEEKAELRGNAAAAWSHAAPLFEAYTEAWKQAAAASRWDPDFRRESEHAAGRAETWKDIPQQTLEPQWLNHLLAGDVEAAASTVVADPKHAGTGELATHGRQILAHYCRAAGNREWADILDPPNQPHSAADTTSRT